MCTIIILFGLLVIQIHPIHAFSFVSVCEATRTKWATHYTIYNITFSIEIHNFFKLDGTQSGRNAVDKIFVNMRNLFIVLIKLK